MLRRRPKKLPRLAGDNFLLRRTYEAELHAAELDLDGDYVDWLRDHGVNAATGKMTDAGFAFFKTLIEQQNALNRAKRARRQAA